MTKPPVSRRTSYLVLGCLAAGVAMLAVDRVAASMPGTEPPPVHHGDRPLRPKYPAHVPVNIDARLLAADGTTVISAHARGWNVEGVKLETGIEEDADSDAVMIFPALQPDGSYFFIVHHDHRVFHTAIRGEATGRAAAGTPLRLHGAGGATIEITATP